MIDHFLFFRQKSGRLFSFVALTLAQIYVTLFVGSARRRDDAIAIAIAGVHRRSLASVKRVCTTDGRRIF